jgi:AraC-like DNA-binding protein
MESDIDISDATEAGQRSVEWVVRAGDAGGRPWLADAPLCAALGRYGIAHVGVARAAHPYRVVRTHLSGTFVMSCLEGSGEVRLHGRWTPMPAGMSCVAPPHALHAYRAVPRRRWTFAWVRYEEVGGAPANLTNRAPVLERFDGAGLGAAITGLHREASLAGGAGASPAALELWAQLVEHYAQALLGRFRGDDRLMRVWHEVGQRVDEDWPLARLAKVASLGEKQFTRLTRKMVGRSPTQHVAWLRLQRAAHLLATTDDKVEAIARSVGYRSPFTFSSRFQRFAGCRPSTYRRMAKPPRDAGAPPLSRATPVSER